MKRLSLWEKETYFNNWDYAVCGAGLVGLSCAIELKQAQPERRVLVFDRASISLGASTKNAGFTCFASVTEILDDCGFYGPDFMARFSSLGHAEKMNALEELLSTERALEYSRLYCDRKAGIARLKALIMQGLDVIGHDVRDYPIIEACGGYELLEQRDCYGLSWEALIACINRYLAPLFKQPIFSLLTKKERQEQGFQGIDEIIINPFEGRIHTGWVYEILRRLAASMGITFLSGLELLDYQISHDKLRCRLQSQDYGPVELTVGQLCLATNAFVPELTHCELTPGRGQVIVAQPEKPVKFDGIFHLDKGYYYLRNFGKYLLFGGGRHLFYQQEQSRALVTTENVTEHLRARLERLLGCGVEITDSWAGIMAFSNNKIPCVYRINARVSAGVKLGGMGVALGNRVGKALAEIAVGG